MLFCKKNAIDLINKHINFSYYDLGIEKVMAEYVITPAEDYFNGYVLGYTKGSSGDQYSWYDYGHLRWQDVLCMMLVWVVELFILFKGLKVYGKVAYFITLSPYFVLTAFLAYGLTKEGAQDGIEYYIKPNWDDLWVMKFTLIKFF